MSANVPTYTIDQAATFEAVAFLSCDPKTAFRSDVQEMTKDPKDPKPKWEIQVVTMTRDAFGRPVNSILKVGVASHRNPGEGLLPYTPVVLSKFQIGVMEKTKRNPETGEEKVIGFNVWYRADAIKALNAVPSK